MIAERLRIRYWLAIVNRFIPSIIAAGLLTPAGIVWAQEAATVPVGVMKVTIPAGSISNPSVSTFSIPLRETVSEDFVGQSVGRITGVTSTSISNSNAGWTPGALSQPASPFFLRITSGSAAGRTLQISTSAVNSATNVTVLNQGTDLSTLGIATGPNGDTYEIFPADSLASVFSDSTLAGTSSASADVVRLHNGATWSEYYFNSSANQWRIGSVPVNQSNVVLRPDAGITFYRRGSTPLEYSFVGVVPSTPIRTVVNNSGVTYVGNAFPVDQTISSSEFNSLPGWINNTGNPAVADKVAVWGGSSYNYYNYNQSAAQWRVGSVPVNQNSVVIPAGRPAIIERPNAGSGVTILVRNLPYNLNP